MCIVPFIFILSDKVIWMSSIFIIYWGEFSTKILSIGRLVIDFQMLLKLTTSSAILGIWLKVSFIFFVVFVFAFGLMFQR